MTNPIKLGYRLLEGWFNFSFGSSWNPLYNLGTLTFFFFWVVLVSGLYLFIFFDTSIAGAYKSVEYITHEQWYTVPASMPTGAHSYALKIQKPGQSAWTVIPSTNTPAGPNEEAVLNITTKLPDMSGDDFFNTLNKIRPELTTYASRTSWGLSEY